MRRQAGRIRWAGVLVVFGVMMALLDVTAPVHAYSGDCVTSGATVTCTYAYTGAAQTWTAPAGVTEATFDVYGAQGGGFNGVGGQGGRAMATLSVTPGALYQIMVGGAGGAGSPGTPYTSHDGNGGNGGFNGGGNGSDADYDYNIGSGGGGASDVRAGDFALAERIIVAGGGGGRGGDSYTSGGAGGSGGGTSGGGGGSGTSYPSSIGGAGGTQTSGGAGGASSFSAGTNGSLGQGGGGSKHYGPGDGGGGGGYFGGGSGGGGGFGTSGGGGGGGSGYGPVGVAFEPGVRGGDGIITITYSTPVPPTNTATATETAVPPTNTPTNTPTATATAVPPTNTATATATATAVPPTSTATAIATVTPPSGPGGSILDTFNRANGTVGANWNGLTGSSFYRIASNQLDVEAGGPLVWKTAFGTSQAAFVTLRTIDAKSPSQGVLLKIQSSSIPDAGAIVVVYDAAAKAVRVSTLQVGAKTWTLYASKAATFTTGDVLGARASANGTVQIFKNSTLLTTMTLNAADQTFFNAKGGRIGVWTVAASKAVLDDFGGGTVAP